MAIILFMKDPRITLYIEGEIKDDEVSVKGWDEMFGGRVLITKSYDKKKTLLIPLDKDSSIAYGVNATDSEIEERKLKQKQFEEEQLRQKGKGGLVDPVTIIPSSKRH